MAPILLAPDLALPARPIVERRRRPGDFERRVRRLLVRLGIL